MYDQSKDVELLQQKKKIKKVVDEDAEILAQSDMPEHNGINFKKIIIRLVLLFLVAFLLFYIFANISKNQEKKVTDTNFGVLKSAAYNFFTDNNPPEHIGESKSVTLRVLKELSYVTDIKSAKGNSCVDTSKVEITKTNDTRYNVKASLTCDNETNTQNYIFTFNNGGAVETGTLYLLTKDKITNNIVYECPDGYILDGTDCYSKEKTLTAGATPVYKTIKGSNSKASFNKGTTTYDYANPIIKQDQSTFTCPSGTSEIDGECRTTTSYSTVNACPSGYTKSGSTCYRYTDANKITGNWGNKTKVTSYSWIEDYENDKEKMEYYDTRTNSKGTDYYIYYKYTRSIKYSCPEGSLKNTSQCYITTSATTQKSCPSGYMYSNKYNNCYKTYAKKEIIGQTTYTCPSGYTQKGTGKSTKCEKKIVSGEYYYCKNVDARLEGDRCVTDTVSSITRYTCPSGYKLNGSACYKYTKSSKTKSTKSVEQDVTTEYFWNKNKDLKGWTWTGETKEA